MNEMRMPLSSIQHSSFIIQHYSHAYAAIAMLTGELGVLMSPRVPIHFA